MASLESIIIGASISLGAFSYLGPKAIKAGEHLRCTLALNYIEKNYESFTDIRSLHRWYRVIREKILPVLEDGTETKERAYQLMERLHKDSGLY